MKLTVRSNIKHNGARYSAGDEAEIDDASAQLLIEAGAAEEWSEPKRRGKKEAEAEPEVPETPAGEADENPPGAEPEQPADEPEKEEPKPKKASAKTARKSKRRG